jgi:hypothetical protein
MLAMGVHPVAQSQKEVTMTFKLFRRHAGFCRYTVEAWVLVGVLCERRTFYGNEGRTVRAEATRWIEQQFARAA